MVIADTLIKWQQRHGRHDLPWQGTRNPYLIWVSEIMLQQTQVATVIPYFRRFVERFPDIATLAQATEEEVLTHWAGLGYYARGRNLHRAALQIALERAGEFPRRLEEISALPGIGRSTAAAIAAFAFGERTAILDGNVKRVLIRLFAIDGSPDNRKTVSRLWELAENLLPERDIETYTQGLMDLGAAVCIRRRPRCQSCPLQTACQAFLGGNAENLPVSRLARTTPTRHAKMLIIRHGFKVLLEKRASPGIWGGLWSLPQTEEKADPTVMCLNLTGARPTSIRVLPDLVHAFTHFRLHIEPHEIILDALPVEVAGTGRIWMPVKEAINAAIPRPVARLLASLP